MNNNSIGELLPPSKDSISPYFLTKGMLEILLTRDENVEYDMEDIKAVRSGRYDLDTIIYYLSIIEGVKRLRINILIEKNNILNLQLNELIRMIAPTIKFVNESKFIITNSPFNRALSDPQKAMLYIWNRSGIKNAPISLPKRYRTPEFYKEVGHFYQFVSDGKICLLKESSKELIKINGIVSRLVGGKISIDQAIQEVDYPYSNSFSKKKAVAFTKKDER